MQNSAKTVIIGAGAAGLMAAANISAPVLVLERNEKAGKKLYITGKGRCNLTNDCPPDEFLKNVTAGARFLQGVINRFPPSFVMSFFEGNGLPLKTERGRRVFPVSDKASDVTKTLINTIIENAVSNGVLSNDANTERNSGGIVFGANVTGIRPAESGFDIYYENDSKKHKIHADIVVVACGGKGYPATGSDGSIYNILKALGHTVTDLNPSLVPFVLSGDVSALRGISLKHVGASVSCDVSSSKDATSSTNSANKSVTSGKGEVNPNICGGESKAVGKGGAGNQKFSAAGELLFTDKGVSGPVILTLSALCARHKVNSITLDLRPGDTEDDLDSKLTSLLKEDGARAVKNTLSQLLPKSLAWYIIDYAGINLDKKSADINKAERAAIVGAIKRLTLWVERTGGFEEAVVTSGGVNLKEIDPKTMQSKLHENLYIIGETLDIDALTGGYNLQLAWSTALAAAENISNKFVAEKY